MGRGAGSIAKLAPNPNAYDHANRARHPTRPTRKSGLLVSGGNQQTTKKFSDISLSGSPKQRHRRPELFQKTKHT